jgi:hypothetical protein
MIKKVVAKFERLEAAELPIGVTLTCTRSSGSCHIFGDNVRLHSPDGYEEPLSDTLSERFRTIEVANSYVDFVIASLRAEDAAKDTLDFFI